MDNCRRWLPSLRSSILLILEALILVSGHLSRQIHLTLCGRWRSLGSGLEQRPFLQARRLSNHICVLSFSKSILVWSTFFWQNVIYVKGLRRSGIDKNTGNNWLRVEQPKETKIVFKQVLVTLIMFIIFTVMMKLRQYLLQWKARLKCAGTLWSGLTRTTTSSSRPRLAQMSKVALSIWLAWNGYNDKTLLSKTILILFSLKVVKVLRECLCRSLASLLIFGHFLKDFHLTLSFSMAMAIMH